MSPGRGALVVALVVLAGVAVRTMPQVRAESRLNLSALPYSIGAWRGVEAPPPDDDTLEMLAADATLHRVYTTDTVTPVGVYAAYYARQRPGVSVHSPLHCLPGTGWEPLQVSTVPLPADAPAGGTMRRMVVRKSHEQALVLYWYSIGSRTTGSEVSSKLLLLAGHATLRPHGAALVRIVVPVVNGSVEAAEAEAMEFARQLVPHWHRLVNES